MSSYDPVARDELVTPAELGETMRLVRLQIAIPISVLMSMGANLVCALTLKPGLAGISELNPTLLSPNASMVGLYWAVLFGLQVGFCLVLLLVRKDVTKETLIHGIGLRFAIANWLQAAWAVCFTLQFFIGAELLLLVNVVNLMTIHFTLNYYPATLKRPIDALFIHAPMTMLLAILLNLDWLHTGFIALGWVTEDRKAWGKYTWQAVACVAAVNVVVALWAGFKRIYILSLASEYLLFTLLFSSPRSQPNLPTSALPKPSPLLVTLIICLVLHPITLIAGMAWQRAKEREGRIRLEEDVEAAEERERVADRVSELEAQLAEED